MRTKPPNPSFQYPVTLIKPSKHDPIFSDGIEDTMFDVISCYYPVDFTPPTDTEVPVTPEDLRSRLDNCFIASNKLAPLAIPFLSEKFNSSLQQVSKDGYY